MYATYFNLREAPFSILPDPRFLYFSRCHAMALSMLEYGVLNQAGFTVVTGEIGSGKTTLVRHLLNNIGNGPRVGLINQTLHAGDNLLEWLFVAFDRPNPGGSQAAMYKAFRDFILESATRGERVVLIVDEAQNLRPAHMEELRTLSNVNEDAMMFQLILVGQPELGKKLSAPTMRQFAQRISSDFHLHRLASSEVEAYLEHRLTVAGGSLQLIDPAARRLIAKASTCVPRKINILADRCFAYAYGMERKRVTLSVVQKVLSDRSRHGVSRLVAA